MDDLHELLIPKREAAGKLRKELLIKLHQKKLERIGYSGSETQLKKCKDTSKNLRLLHMIESATKIIEKA